MDHRQRGVIHPRLVLGLAILALGALLALESLDVFHLHIHWSEYWPVILIVLGLSRILQPWHRHRAFGFVMVFLGSWFLARNLTGYDLDRFFFPILLLVVGGSLVLCSFNGRRRSFSGGGPGAGISPGAAGGAASLHPFALLGGARAASSSQEFLGGSATALLGSCVIDLRQATIPAGQEAVLDAAAFWGGVLILVPNTWSVALHGMPVLGSFQDFTQPPPGGSTQRLVVRGFALMGSVEARNRSERDDFRNAVLQVAEARIRREHEGGR